MQTSLETSPASPYAVLVTMSYGDSDTPTIRRYARWTNDISISGQTFLSEPTLDVELGVQHGGTEDKPHKVTMSSKRDPFSNLILGFRHSKVHVVIEQLNPSDLSTRRHLGEGDITLIVKNPNGRPGLARATVGTLKLRIADTRVGIQANSTCDNLFGNDPTSPCRLDVSAWIRTGTVASVMTPDRNVITLTLPGVSTPATQLPNNRYRRSYIEVDGLRLAVKRSLENRSFELFSIPAPYLVGRPAILHPGCDGRLETCRLWNNEQNFNGDGATIPKYNPVFENPNG